VTAEQGWTREKEHGSPALVRLIIWLTLRLGWPVGQVLLVPITAYFFVTLSRARAASRAYLARILGRPASTGEVWRHFFTFACVTLDRICFLANRAERFRIAVHGLDCLEAALAAGRGCILLGSHLGSFEVLRAFGRSSPVPVRALMYRGTTAALSTFMEALDPAIRQDVIEIGSPTAMLRVRESLARGEIVGILADRGPPSHRKVTASFLGGAAEFPSGPWVLAATLGAPVFLFHGVRTGRRRYRVVIEPFAERVVLRREARAADLQLYVGRYAAALERACRAHPHEWFNFFPFWESANARSGPARPAAAAAPGLAERQPG
jgi:predicted LPLAT superfamily acyltransferase